MAASIPFHYKSRFHNVRNIDKTIIFLYIAVFLDAGTYIEQIDIENSNFEF